MRDRPTEAIHRLRAIESPEDIVVGDLVLLEILQGARDERHAREIEQVLPELTLHPMLSPDLATAAARLYRLLRNRGVTLNPIADLIIATFCIESGHVLLHDDRHFEPMHALGLKTLS